MNFTNHKHSFSFRTIKGYGLAGAVIASVLVSQGVVAAEQVAQNKWHRTTKQRLKLLNIHAQSN